MDLQGKDIKFSVGSETQSFKDTVIHKYKSLEEYLSYGMAHFFLNASDADRKVALTKLYEIAQQSKPKEPVKKQ